MSETHEECLDRLAHEQEGWQDVNNIVGGAVGGVAAVAAGAATWETGPGAVVIAAAVGGATGPAVEVMLNYGHEQIFAQLREEQCGTEDSEVTFEPPNFVELTEPFNITASPRGQDFETSNVIELTEPFSITRSADRGEVEWHNVIEFSEPFHVTGSPFGEDFEAPDLIELTEPIHITAAPHHADFEAPNVIEFSEPFFVTGSPHGADFEAAGGIDAGPAHPAFEDSDGDGHTFTPSDANTTDSSGCSVFTPFDASGGNGATHGLGADPMTETAAPSSGDYSSGDYSSGDYSSGDYSGGHY